MFGSGFSWLTQAVNLHNDYIIRNVWLFTVRTCIDGGIVCRGLHWSFKPLECIGLSTCAGLYIGGGRCLAEPSDHELWISQLITVYTILAGQICTITVYNASLCTVQWYTVLHNATQWYTVLLHNATQLICDRWLNHWWVIPPSPQFSHSLDLTLERCFTNETGANTFGNLLLAPQIPS